jgi:hypothetical protein
MINLSGVQRRWQKIQDDMITFYNHTLTIVYKDTYTGSGIFDYFSNESLTPNDPLDTTNTTVSRVSSLVVTGMATSSMGLSTDPIHHLPIGFFEPGQAVFTCRVRDVVNSGVNAFAKADYCILSLDNEKYIPVKYVTDGLKDLYVYHIVLAKTNK